MCTVTFVSAGASVFLTSNRDEKAGRPKAVSPHKISAQDGKLVLCPKDLPAGGSWIGLKDNRDAGVLLNGSAFRHVKRAAYRKSRGLVFLEIMGEHSPLNGFNMICLEAIEPFTLILFMQNRLLECRWDAVTKQVNELDPARNHIWSSATLYTHNEQIEKRKRFFNFLQINPIPSQQEILGFHRESAIGGAQTEIIRRGREEWRTVSITSISISSVHSRLSYQDSETGICSDDGFADTRNCLNAEAGSAN